MERSLNASLRQQQDEAYEVSLRADQEKERMKMEERQKEQQRRQMECDNAANEEKRKLVSDSTHSILLISSL